MLYCKVVLSPNKVLAEEGFLLSLLVPQTVLALEGFLLSLYNNYLCISGLLVRHPLA